MSADELRQAHAEGVAAARTVGASNPYKDPYLARAWRAGRMKGVPDIFDGVSAEDAEG